MKIKRPKTRLWNISVKWERGFPVVVVKAGPVRSNGSNANMIRACTAKAAGRRYIRKNLAYDMASADQETENPGGTTYMDMKPEWVDRFRGYAKSAVVRVTK